MLMFLPTTERREKRGVFELSVSQVIEDAPGVMIGSNYPNWANNPATTTATTTKVCLVKILTAIMKLSEDISNLNP